VAAYHRVYDSRHLQADCKKPGISSGTLRSVIEYGLRFLLGYFSCGLAPPLLGRDVTSMLTSSESVSARVCVCSKDDNGEDYANAAARGGVQGGG